MYTTLIDATQLIALQEQSSPVLVFDCSFDLGQPGAGRQAYEAQHIQGALYAHLDEHLSAKGQSDAASGGRHPLPSRERFAGWLGNMGVEPGVQVVVYDRQGAHYCGRLWWMLKWVGHSAVAVLDGGWNAWLAAGGATASGVESKKSVANYPLGPMEYRHIAMKEVAINLGSSHQSILDARGAPRFRGEVEPLDPVAGHIPGALNRPFTDNFQADGRFKPAAQLREEFAALLGTRVPVSVVHQCGSGVTAVPNLLAMEIAGLHGSALFAGSWSEWCSDPANPVARG